MKSRADLAALLGIKESVLTYLLYKVTESDKYTTFQIPKRNGGTREISSPVKALKAVQRRLAEVLLKAYPDRACVHGFLKAKNVKSNASAHLHRKWVVNIDIKDFFPSIHFGRVKGLFLNRPFCLPADLARELATLCCKDAVLPQGAPTSPIISNYICWRLDNQLQQLAKGSRCFYTRYADDITFSSSLPVIPPEIGTVSEDGKLVLSDRMMEIFSSNGFKVNEDKTRYSFRIRRQEVTGLVVNSGKTNVLRKYVMRVRAMIHSWERYGLEKAAEEHFLKYNYKRKEVVDKQQAFVNELVGMLGYIRYIKSYKDGVEAADSMVYIRLARRVKALKADAKVYYHIRASEHADKPMIYCEGKTDWMLLKRALEAFRSKGEFLDLDIAFREYGPTETAGVSNLIEFCKVGTISDLKYPGLCVFDRDVKSVSSLIPAGKDFAYKGHNIYAVYIPVPDFRTFPEICIEHLFSDEEIQTADDSGRRLYLSTEFDSATGIHKKNPSLRYTRLSVLKAKYPRILDSGVIDTSSGDPGRNVALPKREFAYNIATSSANFADFSFEGFHPFFELVREILH